MTAAYQPCEPPPPKPTFDLVTTILGLSLYALIIATIAVITYGFANYNRSAPEPEPTAVVSDLITFKQLSSNQSNQLNRFSVYRVYVIDTNECFLWIKDLGLTAAKCPEVATNVKK